MCSFINIDKRLTYSENFFIFDDLLGYCLPRVGLQSIDLREEEGTVVALYRRRRTDMDEEAGISIKVLRSGDAQHMRQNEDIYGIRLHFSE